MKILRLRFCNVNSISGEWIIDFSHRDYLSDGIFAICGPTGAGKSTILDAICIALYGQTPRTGKITEGSNEVMTRNTGYFFSELLFETDEGKFLSHFSQNKAKKNLNGNLQSPKHELSDYKTGIIIANKLKEVSLEIVKKTGMDFERFTRSMLLAQNSFADFLKSSGDEKAPMLEQITGTKIYSDISKKVHEINKIKKSELEIIKSELSNIILFSQQEIDDFNNVLKVKKNEEELLLKKKNILEDKLSFMKKIAENENNRENILNDIQNNKKKIIDFEPEILKLNKIIKSMNFSDEINLYKNNIEFKKNEMERLVLLENEIKNIESQIKTKEFLRVKLEEEFKKVKEEKLIVYENINKIIPIDIKLNDLNKTIFNKEKVINEEKQIVKNVKLDFDKNQHFINDLIFKIKEMGKKLNSLEIVEISEEKYTNLKILHSNNLNNYKEVNILEENSEKLKKDILDYESELKINEKNLIENSINMKEIEKEITKLNDDIINILKEKDEDFIIDFIEENKNYIRNIDNVSEIYKELNIKKEKISKNIQQTQLNSKEIENKNNELKLLEKNYNILKETVSLLEKKFILSNNIKNLKELRNNLVN
ncbi:MAG: AAA family ATPase, partial [Candidatus Muirbacterium halophilum]|nr:AAA family ATPase [Candidatus Muirbacterium halophilum]